MPAAVPAIVGFAATSAAVSAGFVVAGTLAATAVGFAASGITSLAMGAMTKPKAADTPANLSTPGAGRTTQVRQPIVAHQLIYGQTKTSGPVLFIHSQEDDFGRTYGNLYLVHGLCGTKIKAIRTVYFGDELATAAKFQIPGSQIRIGKHLGETDQAADADFVAEIGAPYWTSNHRLRGRAYIATRLTWDSENLPQLENISAIVDGIDSIYDPRTGLTGFTNNAALCVANWLTSPYGEGRAWSKLHQPSLIEAANICDERVLVLQSTTTATVADATLTLASGARVLDWGDGVRFTSSGALPTGIVAGTTYYVIPWADEKIRIATSVANAFAGTHVAVGSDGTGTLTMRYYDEARYKCNGTFTLDTEKGEVLDQLRGAMAGYAFPRGGKWYVHAGAAALPAVTLTDDDLRAYPEVRPKRRMRDRFNGVRGIFVNPEKKWQPSDAPPRVDAAYVAEDADEELITELQSNFIISERQMQRVMKIELERNRLQGEVDLPCKLSAFRLAPLDGAWLTLGGFFAAAQHRVTGWALADDQGINIKLQEDSADAYRWTTEDELVGTALQGLVLPNPDTIAAPDELTVTTPTTPTFTQLEATWTAVKNIFRDGYDFEFRDDGDTDWNSIGRITDDTQDNDVNRVVVITSTATDMQVRTVTKSGAPSTFLQNLAPDAPGAAAAVDTEITWTNAAGAAEVQVFKNASDSSVDNAVLFDTVDGTDEAVTVDDDAYYWLRSVNEDGNISSLTAAITVGTPGGGGGD